MVDILPLRALRYGATHAVPTVFSPPYDVISPAQRAAYLARNPDNVVRLTLGPTPDDRTWYGAAREARDHWLQEGILERDVTPAFYGYQQRFHLADGCERSRTGLVALVRLSDASDGIYRHERTRLGPRVDRLMLMRAMEADMSCVWALYGDPQGDLQPHLQPPERPDLDFVFEDGVRQIFWRIDDPARVAALVQGMAGRPLMIADGHHRYETAMTYRAERRQAEGNPPEVRPYDYVLMYLTANEDPGLVLLATHRVIAPEPTIDAAALLDALHRDFEVLPAPEGRSLTEAAAEMAGSTVAIGACLGHAGRWILRLRSLDAALCAAAGHGAGPLAELDVNVLQYLVLGPHLGISAEVLAQGERVSYTIHEDDACGQVQRGEAAAAFILNPTTGAQVWQAADRGVTMPQKSTYFYPKPLTGLLFNPLDAF
ncbi:MAG: DUF1015 domain-containing protein [Anaerolineae bacterium]